MDFFPLSALLRSFFGVPTPQNIKKYEKNSNSLARRKCSLTLETVSHSLSLVVAAAKKPISIFPLYFSYPAIKNINTRLSLRLRQRAATRIIVESSSPSPKKSVCAVNEMRHSGNFQLSSTSFVVRRCVLFYFNSLLSSAVWRNSSRLVCNFHSV